DDLRVHLLEARGLEVIAMAVGDQAEGAGGLRNGVEVVPHVAEGARLVGEVGVERRLAVADREGHVADEGGGETGGLGTEECGGQKEKEKSESPPPPCRPLASRDAAFGRGRRSIWRGRPPHPPLPPPGGEGFPWSWPGSYLSIPTSRKMNA